MAAYVALTKYQIPSLYPGQPYPFLDATLHLYNGLVERGIAHKLRWAENKDRDRWNTTIFSMSTSSVYGLIPEDPL